ncbi:unnamed protein product [Lampetra planeri]
MPRETRRGRSRCRTRLAAELPSGRTEGRFARSPAKGVHLRRSASAPQLQRHASDTATLLLLLLLHWRWRTSAVNYNTHLIRIGEWRVSPSSWERGSSSFSAVARSETPSMSVVAPATLVPSSPLATRPVAWPSALFLQRLFPLQR